jgi:hypothetical protein
MKIYKTIQKIESTESNIEKKLYEWLHMAPYNLYKTFNRKSYWEVQ